MTACSAVVLCVDDVSPSSPCEQLTIDRSINTVITKAIEQVVLEDLQKIVQILGLADEKDMFSAILLYIEANPEIFKMIFSQNTTAHIRDKLGELFEKLRIEIWPERANKNELTEIQSLLIHHHVQGSLAIVAKWTRNDYKISKELIVKSMSIADQAAEEFIMKE